jgi:lipid-binding SYLF domain-containing protein
MKQLPKFILILLSIAALAGARIGQAAPAEATLDEDASAALNALFQRSPDAKPLAEIAKGVLVFPNIDRLAVLVGVQSGKGAMLANGKVVGHYRIDGVIAGLEAGGQSYAYAVFFMSDKALESLHSAHGFNVGAGPSIVFVDAGLAKEFTTTTAQADVFGYVFNQKGLIGGIALQGLKITKVDG